VTVSDGQWGYFADGALVPFVTDVIPVVGDQPQGEEAVGERPYGPRMSPLEERLARLRAKGRPLVGARREGAAGSSGDSAGVAASDPLAARLARSQESSAGQPDESLSAIRARQAAADSTRQEEAQGLFAQGRAAESAGQQALARYYYQLAHRRAAGKLREEIGDRLEALERN
jgi:hypothetical protein